MTLICKKSRLPAALPALFVDAGLRIGRMGYQEKSMISCPRCLHQNVETATQCEVCQTSLSMTSFCPNCGASMPQEATFCGQCGVKLGQTVGVSSQAPSAPELPTLPDLEPPNTLFDLEQLAAKLEPPKRAGESISELTLPPLPATPYVSKPTPAGGPQTQLQRQAVAHLLHVHSGTTIALPLTLSVIHIGKQNEQIPPDIDVAGFPHSEVVSRIHANIRLEADSFFIEDIGSANGTYINHTFLPPGNRHRLRHGDRIALGKGDLVSFLFQLD